MDASRVERLGKKALRRAAPKPPARRRTAARGSDVGRAPPRARARRGARSSRAALERAPPLRLRTPLERAPLHARSRAHRRGRGAHRPRPQVCARAAGIPPRTGSPGSRRLPDDAPRPQRRARGSRAPRAGSGPIERLPERAPLRPRRLRRRTAHGGRSCRGSRREPRTDDLRLRRREARRGRTPPRAPPLRPSSMGARRKAPDAGRSRNGSSRTRRPRRGAGLGGGKACARTRALHALRAERRAARASAGDPRRGPRTSGPAPSLAPRPHARSRKPHARRRRQAHGMGVPCGGRPVGRRRRKDQGRPLARERSGACAPFASAPWRSRGGSGRGAPSRTGSLPSGRLHERLHARADRAPVQADAPRLQPSGLNGAAP